MAKLPDNLKVTGSHLSDDGASLIVEVAVVAGRLADLDIEDASKRFTDEDWLTILHTGHVSIELDGIKYHICYRGEGCPDGYA